MLRKSGEGPVTRGCEPWKEGTRLYHGAARRGKDIVSSRGEIRGRMLIFVLLAGKYPRERLVTR